MNRSRADNDALRIVVVHNPFRLRDQACQPVTHLRRQITARDRARDEFFKHVRCKQITHFVRVLDAAWLVKRSILSFLKQPCKS